jgi:hypothetical protein
MPNLIADEIITQKHKRLFIQYGGAKPTNETKYYGQDAQYMSVEGVSLPESGGIDPIWVHDPSRIGKYRLIGRTITAPDLANATLLMREKHGVIPRQLLTESCPFNLYEPTGKCKDLSDFLQGWSDYVLVYSGALVTDKDLGARTSWDADDAIEDSLSITLAEVYPVGQLGFGEEAATTIFRAVVDVVYGNALSCYCEDPTKFVYAVTGANAGSPGLPAEVVYTVDGGGSWATAPIAGIGAAEDALAIDLVGNYLVVIGLDAIYYAEINQDTGVPGAFTKVGTGFVAAGSPTDLYVASPREVWFCGDGGYIYKSTDITAGVTVISAGDATASDLNRIHGVEETIVAVGDTGAVIKSTNRGLTWATTTASPVAANLTAIWVLDDKRFWVGSATGFVYYTLNGGESWTSQAFSGSGAGQVNDIVFATNEVGYISHSTAVPAARIFSTWDGGSDWTNAKPRILNLPTFDHAYRLAVPKWDAGIAANNIAVAGLAGNGTDGILLLGIAASL